MFLETPEFLEQSIDNFANCKTGLQKILVFSAFVYGFLHRHKYLITILLIKYMNNAAYIILKAKFTV